MKFLMGVLLCLAIGYLLGSCNSALIVVKLLKHEDIREKGSGNAGLTNALRCYGKGIALLTLIGDLTKGVVAVLLCRYLWEHLGIGLPIPSGENVTLSGFLTGIGAIYGHIFPLYAHFRGGKGVLVGVSIFLILNPLIFLFLIAVFSLVLWRSNYVSLGSVIGTLFAIPSTFLLEWLVMGEPIGYSAIYAGMAFLMAIPIVVKHKDNLVRVKNGTERKFRTKKEG